MSASTGKQLQEDIEKWRNDLERLPVHTHETFASVIGLTYGSRRLRRLFIALTNDPTFPTRRPVRGIPPETETEGPPTTEELLGDGAEPIAKPRTVTRQTPEGDIVVETQGNDGGGDLPPSRKGGGVVRNVEELAREAEIDLTQWTDDGSFHLRRWATPIRKRHYDPKGRRMTDTIDVVGSWYIRATFRRRWDSLVTPADWGAKLSRRPRLSQGPSALALVIPDVHVGYQWNRNHTALHSIHDWAALDAVLQLAQVLAPDVIQFLGDVLDNAAFSEKFKASRSLQDTARPSILTAHAVMRDLRERFPKAEIDYQGGNHEERTERQFVGTEWEGLTPAGSNGPSVNSFAHLLNLDLLDITHRSYGNQRFLWDLVGIEHGSKVKSRGGLTVAEILRDSTTSRIFGHIHRREIASRTIHDHRGLREITVASPGTLARLDGSTPGVTKTPDWQHGLAIVTLDRSRGQEHIDLVPVIDGRILYRGISIVGDGRRLADEIGQRIGYPQIASYS